MITTSGVRALGWVGLSTGKWAGSLVGSTSWSSVSTAPLALSSNRQLSSSAPSYFTAPDRSTSLERITKQQRANQRETENSVCVFVCVRAWAYTPPTTRCWMQPLNNLEISCNLIGRRDCSPKGSPPMKNEAGDKRENLPGDRATDFLYSSSTCTDRDLKTQTGSISINTCQSGQAGIYTMVTLTSC